MDRATIANLLLAKNRKIVMSFHGDLQFGIVDDFQISINFYYLYLYCLDYFPVFLVLAPLRLKTNNNERSKKISKNKSNIYGSIEKWCF